ncbi:MAG: FAD-dependent oxidoreductase [Verrucomicrobia bacterium]|jgi:hypothetical protein|nr:FAD-dependent oxidoreductase [Verrucomicrobiota bacterium]
MHSSQSVTFQASCDVLVCGSTLYAIDAAIEAASKGRRTVLAMERTNPLIESICSLRAHVAETADLSASPALADIMSMEPQTYRANGRLYFNPHRAALRVEDRLIDAGVTFYYNAMPVSALMSSGEIHGAVFGGKPGLFAIEARHVIDCTLNSVMARTAGATTLAQPDLTQASYSIELKGDCPSDTIAFSQGGITGHATIHRFYADFDLSLSDAEEGPLSYARDFISIYRSSLTVLKENSLTRFRGADSYFHSGRSRVEAEDGVVPGVKNLRVIGPMAMQDNTAGQTVMKDPLVLHRTFPEPTDMVGEVPSARPRPTVEYSISGCQGEGGRDLPETRSFSDPGYLEPGTEKRSLRIDGTVASLAADVLIAGCGTSGVGAAYHAGKLGLSPLCIDGALEIGGTNTVGGVTNLWFGNPTHAVEDFFKECGASNDGLNAAPFFQGLERVGASLLPYTPICGTGYSGRNLKCVYVITPDGLLGIHARTVVDATGDGSLAAWSGSDYSFGSERDGVSSWGSFGNFQQGKPEASRQFLSMVDERSAKDTTRFIVAMRRCLKERFEDQPHVHPAFYVAPRTTRHIKGRTTVTYIDVLAGRRFADGVLRARSNIDTKGTETSNAYKAGLYPKDRMEEFEVTIPYSALVPVTFDNVIISGKAYSITNDALTMARMQRDLFVLGIVAAEAVRLSMEEDTVLGDLSVATLQERLIAVGALKREDLAEDNLGIPDTSEIVDSLLGAGDYEETLEPTARLILLGKESAMPLLATAPVPLTPALARLLCFWMVDQGVDYVRGEVERQLGGEALPLAIYAVNHMAHLLPDHGFAPLPALQINNLAQAGETCVAEFVATIADGFEQLLHSKAALWGYTFGVAYAAERTASEALQASLITFISHPIFDVRPVRIDDDWRPCADIDRERMTYLRLCIARALARCGSAKGVTCLIDFLDEARAAFAANARDELMAISGKDFGYERHQWELWLRQNADSLKPSAVTTYY